ncbi:hypothetical protein [Butyrivibrio sp. AC2005]|uniref:hypothetical protein n=1 Tax=Butyrivibrio sp. AC2005 TaxID=1280672 RepID=UPI001FA7ADEA|nr:hypothetical protein [Butyrivibrio sp. AC2005]
MKLISTYSVKIKNYNNIFKQSVLLYRRAVDFYLSLILSEWDAFSGITQIKAVNMAESLSVRSDKRPIVKYDFSRKFYKFPCYLRRGAIAEAFGKASSFMSSVDNWENADTRTRGEKPSYPKAGYVYPALYRGNMFIRTDDYTSQIKVFRNNTWDWIDV